jgi:hypothetical protein
VLCGQRGCTQHAAADKPLLASVSPGNAHGNTDSGFFDQEVAMGQVGGLGLNAYLLSTLLYPTSCINLSKNEKVGLWSVLVSASHWKVTMTKIYRIAKNPNMVVRLGQQTSQHMVDPSQLEVI